jgi:soluble lytic murein transglycosylase-like protein
LAVVCIGALLVFIWLGSSSMASPTSALAMEAQVSGTRQPLSGIFQPEIQYWQDAIQGWAGSTGLDPNLIATVMQIESCGDPQAQSGAGAMGLFQVMPYHFSITEDPFLPDTNATRGLDYLKRSLEASGGDPRLALAGYNGGLGMIVQPEFLWPSETRRYAYWGSGIYADATSGATQSPRLQEWLAAGGSGLCRQADRELGLNP